MIAYVQPKWDMCAVIDLAYAPDTDLAYAHRCQAKDRLSILCE